MSIVHYRNRIVYQCVNGCVCMCLFMCTLHHKILCTTFHGFQLCIKLGWNGEGTKWDLLPLILSANGHDPDYFDIPRELVLEVSLVHPT